MQISQTGINLIKHYEGCVLHPYNDGYGFMTIGWGHLIHKGEQFPTPFTQAEADSLFLEDIIPYETAVNNAVKVKLTQNQFDSLVSFCYNVGPGNFLKSSLLVALNQSNYSLAASDFPKYDMSAGRISVGLAARRKAEQTLFNTP